MSINAKRLQAYIIDLLIMILFMYIISFLFKNSSIEYLYLELNNLKDLSINNKVSILNNLEKYSMIIYQIDKHQMPLYIINIFYIIIYFIFIPFVTKGQTIGKKIMHIKISMNDDSLITISSLTKRSFITTGILISLILIIMIHFIPSNLYFYMVSIFAFIQVLLVIISGFMVIYRRDKKGAQDIIGLTKIMEE